MRIGLIQPASFEQYKVNRSTRNTPVSATQNADQLEVSEASRLFSQALQAAQNVPEVRQDRVDTLRQEIEAGTYTRNSREIAARILSGTSEP